MEFVWVVPREVLFPNGAPSGFLPLSADDLERSYLGPAREEGFFMERRYAERHPAYKQVIPYVVVARGDEAFCLTRLPAQSEERLHGLRSIGVGGHVNPCDAADGVDSLLHNACRRELHEELILPGSLPDPTPRGLLNDDSTEVGAVHVGIVYRLEVAGAPVTVRETSAMTGGFQPLAELKAASLAANPPFETWSSFLLESGALESRGSTARAEADPVLAQGAPPSR